MGNEEIGKVVQSAITKLSLPSALGSSFGLVMSKLGIVFTEKVPTYAVTGNGYLLVNPKWHKNFVVGERVPALEENLRGYYDRSHIELVITMFLIMHEFYHIMAGHVGQLSAINSLTDHKVLNNAIDRWANKFAGDGITSIRISYSTSQVQATTVYDSIIDEISRLSGGDWNRSVEIVLGEGFVTDNMLAKIAEKAGVRVPNFDEMTSSEIANWLHSISIEATHRSKLTFGKGGGGSILSSLYPDIDVYSSFEPDDDDEVFRERSDDFKNAKTPEDLEKTWQDIISEAETLASKSIGDAAGLMKKLFQFEKKKSIVNWKQIILGAINTEYSVERVESPNTFDEIYELLKESDPAIDPNTYIYGTEKIGNPPFIVSGDTSGSMYEFLNDVANELDAMLKSKRIRGVIKVDWDSIIEDISFVKKIKDNKMEFAGFGGTSPVPFFQMLLKQKTEENEKHYDKFWMLFRKHKPKKFVVFMSDFEFFDEDVKKSMELLKKLEARGWHFLFISTKTKAAIYQPINTPKAFKRIGNF